ncbi:glycosyl transferase family 2 [Rhodovulum imhoffii]|uniref:Glycosyl transferase family 2 n=1 Tax=Rhodovulum imhoffii TaxID=365340 RepID=A0A2T5BTX5_9RHOB|nr:glycosyltransferase [Rhodovulum imhoffii]MBK5932722.1 glycosyl transferase family 2 [Rhodovulum imhoffii]PTN02928.1 glycosyl transferase family 2 [Rhodovulum imhoffii]
MGSDSLTAPPRVAVLLALFNGARHLQPQLESYCAQTLRPAVVLASDDSPGDGTAERFRQFARADQSAIQWKLVDGPQRGLTANFLSLLAHPEAHADYIALSDQDDIWLPDKLESAVAILAPYSRRPALLGTRSWEWNPKTGRKILSRPMPAPLNFAHALLQNFAGGNTMVLNRAAMDLVRRALPGMPVPSVHDWWLYQLVSGTGGMVLFDPTPRLLYRQHHGNEMGASSGIGPRIRRLRSMLDGTYRDWIGQNLATLHSHADLLTPEALKMLERLTENRDADLMKRLALLHGSGLHRKGFANQTALWLAATLRKL